MPVLLIGLAVLGLALMLVLLVLSFIAQGGMAQATTDLATGHTSSLGRAWSAGTHLFWRYVGLWLFLIATAIVIAAVVGAVVAAVAFMSVHRPGAGPGYRHRHCGRRRGHRQLRGFGAARHPRQYRAALVGRVRRDPFALPIFTVLIVVGLTLSIVVAFAQRAIVVENVGPIDALQSGWRLTRTHVGESLLTWLVNIGTRYRDGHRVGLGVVGALLLLGGIGALVFAVAGLTALTLAYVGLGSLVFVVGVLTLAGIANAFFWTYWTLAYLRLSGHAAPTAAP